MPAAMDLAANLADGDENGDEELAWATEEVTEELLEKRKGLRTRMWALQADPYKKVQAASYHACHSTASKPN